MTGIWDEFEDLRDRFQIVAFHDDRVQSFEELDRNLETVVEKTWRGRSLPFPILLDPSGETLKTYGIRSFPTTVLVDPDGVVVPDGSAERLREILAEMRAER